MAVLKNVENKIKLVMIVSCLFLVGCVVISLGSVIIAKTMVDDAHKTSYIFGVGVKASSRKRMKKSCCCNPVA